MTLSVRIWDRIWEGTLIVLAIGWLCFLAYWFIIFILWLL